MSTQTTRDIMSIIHSWQTLNNSRCPLVDECISKLWYNQTMDYYLVQNEMSYPVMKRHRGILNADY